MILLLPLTLPVWVGHSCPTPLTFILIMTLLTIQILIGKGTALAAEGTKTSYRSIKGISFRIGRKAR